MHNASYNITLLTLNKLDIKYFTPRSTLVNIVTLSLSLTYDGHIIIIIAYIEYVSATVILLIYFNLEYRMNHCYPNENVYNCGIIMKKKLVYKIYIIFYVYLTELACNAVINVDTQGLLLVMHLYINFCL